MSRRKKKLGLPPGSIVYTGTRTGEKVVLHHFQYNEQSFKEETLDNYQKITLTDSPEELIDWYDIRGIQDADLITHIGKAFDIHPLILEDVPEVTQRPKFEEYAKGIFIIVKNIDISKYGTSVMTEQVAIYFRKGLVISFQETESDLFESIRNRITNANGKLRLRKADYLVYALIDIMVDNYFIALEEIEEEIEKLEEMLLSKPDASIKKRMHHLKKELLVVKRAAVPLREAIGRFSKAESEYIEDNTAFFLRDLYDHNIQVIENIESNRDLLNGLQDLLNSEVGYKMNQVIQVLTLVSTIFIPLTFIAGIYGMNFENMPELKTEYGYFAVIAVMFTIFAGLIFFFKKKKWI